MLDMYWPGLHFPSLRSVIYDLFVSQRTVNPTKKRQISFLNLQNSINHIHERFHFKIRGSLINDILALARRERW